MKFVKELTKEDIELEHEVFVNKFRHQPNYFDLLAKKKAGEAVEETVEETAEKEVKKPSTKKVAKKKVAAKKKEIKTEE